MSLYWYLIGQTLAGKPNVKKDPGRRYSEYKDWLVSENIRSPLGLGELN